MSFLPVTKNDMKKWGWQTCDIVLVTGDAYVDHPSFGAAVISRVLEEAGFKVCILAQPRSDADFSRFGVPDLAFFVTGGNIDSMVAHYTAAKKKRSGDSYTPGGVSGKRPDRATIEYTKTIRRIYKNAPVIIGGLEASLRRFAHYDYWSDTVRPSILIESGADILVFGMGEYQAAEIAKRLRDGEEINAIKDIKGTCYSVQTTEYDPAPCAECPSFEAVSEPSESGKKQYAASCRIQHDEHDPCRGKQIIQRHGKRIVVQNPPAPPLSGEELDSVYELPYEREYHPSYEKNGGVPALEEVKFSIIHNRGCFGSCAFCSLAYHQGRAVTARSEESIVREAKILIGKPDFKGYIHDVGGPTANFRTPACETRGKDGMCKGKRCLTPDMCPSVEPDHSEYLRILRRLRNLDGVKKVFVRSGMRFDYLVADPNEEFFKELVKHHISGQLKVAPEHCVDRVLDYMGKPRFSVYQKFQRRFYELTKAAGKEQYIVPYMISSHPGSTLGDAVELALYLKKEKLRPEQVQDFYPTPGTVSTCMYYTGLDPYTLKPVYVPRTPKEKARQRALLQYYLKGNADIVREALEQAGRKDLIGRGSSCLVPPRPDTRPASDSRSKKNTKKSNNKKRR